MPNLLEGSGSDDLDINPTKAKQQTNIRVTPESVRLRKVVLDKIQRLKAAKRGDAAPRLA